MEAVLARRLWSAVRQDDAEAARKCIDSGADVAIKDESGDTPLHYASKHGSLPMVKVLLDAGANPDATNDSQQTPLQYASERGKVKITKLLFESKGRTPVQTASTYKQRPKTVSWRLYSFAYIHTHKHAHTNMYHLRTRTRTRAHNQTKSYIYIYHITDESYC